MAGAAVLLVGSLVYAVLLEALRRRDRGYPSTRPGDSTWWFGYARDLVNVAGWLMFSGGFALFGFAAPASLFCGAVFTLYAYGLDYFLGRALAVNRAHLVLGLVLLASIAAIVILRQSVDRGLQALRALLF
jgi:hypothetical protein